MSSTFKELLRPYYLRWLYFPLFPERRPRYFRAAWEYPPVSKATAPARNPDVLLLPMTDWHTRIQRTQHLARAFAARGQRCFYLNPHLGREFPHPFPFTRSPQMRELEPRIFELHVHLPLEPVFHHRLLSLSESSTISSSITRLLEEAGSTDLVQILSFPTWMEVATRIRSSRNAPLIYDCHDVLSGFRNIAPEIVDAESALFPASDLVLFSSELLYDRHKAAVKGASLLLRNAVDDTILRSGSGGSTSQPGSSRVAGYVGALDFWFDTDAVEQAARRHADWKFILIGRVEDKRVLRLSELANVEFTGEVAHSELPRQLAKFQLALIPFLRNPLTLGTNPIKLYEYFSHGLPVVATRLPELEPFDELIYLYDEGADEFGRQFDRALAESDLRLRARRRQVAERETWPARVGQLDEALGKLKS